MHDKYIGKVIEIKGDDYGPLISGFKFMASM